MLSAPMSFGPRLVWGITPELEPGNWRPVSRSRKQEAVKMFTTEDLFATTDDSAWPGAREIRSELVDALRRGVAVDAPDLEVAIALVELLQTEFVAFGTGGGEQLKNSDVAPCVQALRAVAMRLGLAWTPRWRDFETFRSFWLSHDGYGSWAARRKMVAEEYGALLSSLYERQDAPVGAAVVQQALDALTDSSAIQDHLRRLLPSVDTDPRLAVSVAKDLVESTAKLVLRERGVSYSKGDSLPALVSRSQEALDLAASGVRGDAVQTKALRTILGSLTHLAQGITELRNEVGVGHGRESVPSWVRPRHARLAAGAASTWCNLMLEPLADPEAPWRTAPAVPEA